MCAHNVSGHGNGCRQAIRTPYKLTNKQACASPNKFNHLTCECAKQFEYGYLRLSPTLSVYVHRICS